MEEISSKCKQARNGAVLTFSNILKRDHFPTTTHSSLNIEGAPNFRLSEHNVYGTSQPTIPGLVTILTVLQTSKSKIHWFNTREEPVIYIHGKPFVLRDIDNPKKNLDNSGSLSVEVNELITGINADRLEQMETRLKLEILREVSNTGNILLIHDELHNGSIIEQLVHVSDADVMTLREVMEKVCRKERVEYHRVPIAPNQRPEDLYLDTFARIILKTSLEDPLVFNCGVGSARTTFGMVVALLVRASMQRLHTEKTLGGSLASIASGSRRGSKGTHESNKTLSLLGIIESGLNVDVKKSAVQFMTERSHLLPPLLKALSGDYTVISSLMSVLDYSNTKTAVDDAIDKCDSIINLRHEILVCRIKYFSTADETFLVKSIGYLERYFFLLCFSSFIFTRERNPAESKFSEWMATRHEVLNMLSRLRRTTNRLFLFRPIEDLSTLQTEIDQNVVRERVGTVLHSHVILKCDQWTTESKFIYEFQVEGAPNFRRIASLPIYASAQPTVPALNQIKTYISKSFDHILWINLREEPLCYINGIPYVLRDRYMRLRNMKSYAGISGERLDVLESKLKADVEEESLAYNGMVLVHEEVQGTVKPSWVKLIDVKTMAEVYKNAGVRYKRVPVTSEAPFECSDFDDILLAIINNQGSAFVLNCQMGVGRSSAGCIIVMLILNWLNPTLFSMDNLKYSRDPDGKEVSYQLIHSLVRSIENGALTKKRVDLAIDLCATHVNIRNCIEKYRLDSEKAKSKQETTELLTKGLFALQRYFLLIAFQAYLESQKQPGTVTLTFNQWITDHAELVNMMRESNHSSLQPLGAGKDEILEVVRSRKGGVLAQNMILKFDHFPGCQKKGIPALVDGAPNFRGVDVGLGRVYGVAMPTKDAIEGILEAVINDGGQELIWTSLREEPVIYIRGRPYVLRSHSDPYRNLETTGIERSRVERMEEEMKMDVIAEIERYSGRLMLHEEEAGSNGFRIVPIWENVSAEQVETPNEVFQSIKGCGYNLEYLRVPVTDEQAPIPLVFDMLLGQVYKFSQTVYGIFNCQMGRGRTTTGMVIASIAEAADAFNVTNSPPNSFDIHEMDERQRYLNGNYKIILQLLRVLSFGRFAKFIVDSAIDKCSHIQNIREAIYEYKLRCGDDKMPMASRRRTISDASNWMGNAFDEIEEHEESGMYQVALNYLARYFYLIVFAGYLLEKKSSNANFPIFSEWLNERREILSIVASNIDLY